MQKTKLAKDSLYKRLIKYDVSYKMHNEGRSSTELHTEVSLFGDEKSREGVEELSTVFTLHFNHCETAKKKQQFV